MDQPISELLIVGASCRAAAQSARRAGMEVYAADCFNDLDLRAVSHSQRIDPYPGGLIDSLRNIPPLSWMYTGALENSPHIVGELSRDRPLLGNSAEILTRVRDPFYLAELLHRAGLPVLTVHPLGEMPRNGLWLLKPRNSAGGRRIRLWSEACEDSERLDHADWYLQELAQGEPISALFLASENSIDCIGLTRQMVGLQADLLQQYAYCGSIGPIQLPASVCHVIESIGTTIATACGMRGLFGCDLITDGRTVFLAEVNPRYPASAEIFDWAWNVSLVGWHCASVQEANVGFAEAVMDAKSLCPSAFVAKKVLFAPCDLTVPQLNELNVSQNEGEIPTVADIPEPGSQIQTGQPVCTVLAGGESEAECRLKLRRRESLVWRLAKLD